MCGLNQPGRYTGQLMLSANGYQPLQSPVSVVTLVREHWWRAFIFIAAGVFVSLGIRTYQTSGRPRMVYKRRVLLLLKEIEEEQKRLGALDPEKEARILEGLLRRLEKLEEDLEAASGDFPILFPRTYLSWLSTDPSSPSVRAGSRA
jgi:hypothetical protein